MGVDLKSSCRLSDLAQRLSLVWKGKDINITHVCALDNAGIGGLCFSKKTVLNLSLEGVAVIAPKGFESNEHSVLFSDNPRLDFARALHVLKKYQVL